ncbi:MAG TPA: hypothetical protein VGD92_02655, partial [Sphingobacteriaceae bacterium]
RILNRRVDFCKNTMISCPQPNTLVDAPGHGSVGKNRIMNVMTSQYQLNCFDQFGAEKHLLKLHYPTYIEAKKLSLRFK